MTTYTLPPLSQERFDALSHALAQALKVESEVARHGSSETIREQAMDMAQQIEDMRAVLDGCPAAQEGEEG